MKIPPKIRAALDDTGLPWEIERGRPHMKIKLVGKLVGVLPSHGKRSAHDRAEKNTISQIKRAAMEIRA